MSLRILIAALATVVVLPGLARAAPPTRQQLDIQKLQQEIRKLKLENDRSSGIGGGLLRWGPFVAVAGGVITVLVAVRKEVRENRQQRADELKQRKVESEQKAVEAKQERERKEAELRAQEAEAQRRFDNLFGQAVINLGSDNEGVQASAVVLLETFLGDEYATFHEQVYRILRANLGANLAHAPLVNRLLVHAFEKAIRRRLAAAAGSGDAERLDLANCMLPRVDLHGLGLVQVDLAFSTLLDANLDGADLTKLRGYQVGLERARLSGAVLTEARMHGAQCKDAQFHNARLISAELRSSNDQQTDLRKAEFFGASMQGAHLDGADVRGAKFDDANLSDAYFPGVTYDDDALRSILRAKIIDGKPSWKNANFDPEVLAKLEAAAARRGGGGRRSAKAAASPALVETRPQE
jgi:uncharacterized protein YjbI with pentapeptide repeats